MQRRFEYLPVAMFGSVMGLTGLSAAWHHASVRYGAPEWIAESLAVVAVVSFGVMAAAYAIKVVTAPDAVRAEFAHPIALNTFATFWVSMLLLPIVIVRSSPVLARSLWLLGAVGIFVFAWYVVYRWISVRSQLSQVMPAWILPVVGLLDLPLAVPLLALPHSKEIMTVALAIGLFFAIPLFTLIFYRLLFEEALPIGMEPSLLILVAPFAVGTSAYVATTGQVDLFAESLYALTVFMLAVVLARIRHLAYCCPFKMGWWALSFPMAASAITALRLAEARPGWVTDAIALMALGATNLIIGWLFARTLGGIARGELRSLVG